MTSGRTSLYFDLLDGFKQPGCSVCRFALRAVERFFESLTYENTNDIAIRDGVRAARGFCNRHTAQYIGLGDELGAALIYRDLLHTIIPVLESATPSGVAGLAGQLTDPAGARRAESVVKALAPTAVCLACERLRESDDAYVATLLRHLGSRDFAAAYRQSDALCAPHFGLAMERCHRLTDRDVLLDTQRRRLEALRRQLEASAFDDATVPEALATVAGGQRLRP